MNRVQRRKQPRATPNLRKVGLTYLTTAGVITGTFGLTSPAYAAVYAPTNCAALETDLTALQASGGTLTADFAGSCDFAEGYVFQLATTITGPTVGSLDLQFADGVIFGLAGQSDLTIENLNFVGRPDQVNPITFIQSYSDPLIVSNTTFSNDEVELTSAIYAEGNLTVENSAFTNLSSSNNGPAIYASGLSSAVTISNSTFTGNVALGEFGGGAIFSVSDLEVTNSTFAGNTAADLGGAIAAFSGQKEIKNSTFIENSASSGAAIFLSEGGVIANSTFFNNGDLDTFTVNLDGGSAFFFANILANDTPETVKLFAGGDSVDDLGANLYTDASFSDTTSLEGESRLVTNEELQLTSVSLNQTSPVNTGTTKTIKIGAGSIAKDYYLATSPGINPVGHLNGFLSTTLLPTADQRGVSRPQGLRYDVGAVEIGDDSPPEPTPPPEETENEMLADTGLESPTNFLGLIGVGLAAILGGSMSLIRRRRKV